MTSYLQRLVVVAHNCNIAGVRGRHQSRAFSFKRLPWCVPPASREQAKQEIAKDPLSLSSSHVNACGGDSRVWQASAPANFGIVAAMSKNRIIGLHGKLPWDLPDDRAQFKQLTRDKTLIVGLKTYQDTPEERNIQHVRHCIVVSTTAPEDLGSEKVQVTRSFQEALQLAKTLEPDNDSLRSESPNIDCWIGGGERIYKEALQHRSAYELHLTLVDTVVDVQPLENGKTPEVAMFPSKYRWDRFFEEISRKGTPSNSDTDTPGFEYLVYRRKRR